MILKWASVLHKVVMLIKGITINNMARSCKHREHILVEQLHHL
jgi:hypothetical protein